MVKPSLHELVSNLVVAARKTRIEKRAAGHASKIVLGPCDACGAPTELRMGKYGEFIGCSAYPTCTSTLSTVGVSTSLCEECDDGEHEKCESAGPFADPREDFICVCRCKDNLSY